MVVYLESQFSRLKQYQPPADRGIRLWSTVQKTPPAPPPPTSAPGTYLPERVTTADCPWTPSNSSCREGTQSMLSGGDT